MVLFSKWQSGSYVNRTHFFDHYHRTEMPEASRTWYRTRVWVWWVGRYGLLLLWARIQLWGRWSQQTLHMHQRCCVVTYRLELYTWVLISDGCLPCKKEKSTGVNNKQYCNIWVGHCRVFSDKFCSGYGVQDVWNLLTDPLLSRKTTSDLQQSSLN